LETKVLGRTGLQVSIVGLGGANIGLKEPNDPYRQHILEPSASIANPELGIATVRAALESGATLIDTAPRYQAGASELTIGVALYTSPELAQNAIVTTKLGCTYPGDGFDHSYEKAREIFRQSMRLLGKSSLEIAYLHDPMGFDMNLVMGPNGTMQALRDLRNNGKIKWIGIAANDPDTAADYIETGQFDVATVSGAWSLINQRAAERIFPAAARHNVGIVVTTAIERGLLATGGPENKHYLERNFSPACIARVSQIKALCESFSIPLVAAALQWCTRHPQVACTIPGARIPEEARQNTLAGLIEIPEDFWGALDPLVEHFESYQEV